MRKRSGIMGTILTFVMIAVLLFNTACNTAWIGQAQAIVTTLLPAVTNIITLIAAFQGKDVDPAVFNVVQTGAQEVNNDLQLVNKLLTDYQNAPKDDKNRILSQISAVIQTAQTHLAEILPALHLKNQSLQNKIVAVVGLVGAEIQSLANLIPLVQNNQVQASRIKASKLMSANDFKDAFNDLMTAPTPDPAVNAVAQGLNLR